MAATTIANLWTPDIWIRGANEKMRILPSLLTSGAVRQSPLFDEIANGGGISANMPFFKDITDDDDAIQVEGVAPTINNITAGLNVTPILNREKAYGSNALAAAVSDTDPVAVITDQIAIQRQKRIQKTVLAVLRGLFNFSGAPAAAAALSANRSDVSSETGASPAAGLIIDTLKFNNAVALLGELSSDLSGGAMWVHPLIRAALRNADEIAFEKSSKGEFILETYKGIPLYVSNLLSRAGGTSGTVFDTYLIGAGAIGWGFKPQSSDVAVASLQYYNRPDLNQEQLFDRIRYLVHVNGTRWGGTPAGQSATNTELQTAASWTLVASSADRVPVVQLRTNG